MKVTVCELDDDPQSFDTNWPELVEYIQRAGSDLVLLPEMPFYSWFPSTRPFKREVWEAAVTAHDRWLGRLDELAPAVVLGSRPVETGGKRLNMGFLWEAKGGTRLVHAKHYLPDEDGFWEATWYTRGPQNFSPVEAAGASFGFLICTELWFLEWARAYGQMGAHLLVNPRGTLYATREKWLVGGRAAAIVSGAFCLSSNRSGPQASDPLYGGMGWVIGPDGELLGLTTSEQPFVTVEIDLREAEQAKSTYPRYVKE